MTTTTAAATRTVRRATAPAADLHRRPAVPRVPAGTDRRALPDPPVPGRPTRWETGYLDAVTVLADTLDADEMIRAARELDSRDRIDGVLCWDEARIVAAPKVAQALGPAGRRSGDVLRCRDKHLTRELLAEAGVPQPRSVLVARPPTRPPRPPPRSATRWCSSRGGWPPAWAWCWRPTRPRAARPSSPSPATPPRPAPWSGEAIVLVEEYADGPEISVDCAVLPRRGVADLPGAQGDRLPAVLRGGRPPGRRRRVRCWPTRPVADLLAGAPGARLHRRDHPHRVPAHPVRPEADRGQRPARRRPDPLPRPARHRHRPGPGRGRGRLRSPPERQPRTASGSARSASATSRTR